MNGKERADWLALIQWEISPALGCTEPVAAALCAAGAASMLSGRPERIALEASEYILKNAMNVGIPGTHAVGLEMAGAGEKVDLRSVAEGGGHRGEAVISGNHGHFSRMLRDGQVVSTDDHAFGGGKPAEAGTGLTVAGIWAFIQESREEDFRFLDEAIALNKAAAQEGLNGSYGLQVGQSLLEGDPVGLLGDGLANRAAAVTAAAADARMSGCEKPVMSVAGSGNQGLTATLPVIVLTEEGPAAFREKQRRALALSILVTIHAKEFLGKLSVLCGCSIAAAIGVTAAVVYLYGGTQK